MSKRGVVLAHLLVGVVLVASCAHGRRQVAFGVSAEILRAFANDSCAVVDVEIRNLSARPAFLLTHSSYPHIMPFTLNEDIRLSLHELPGHRILDPHHYPPEGVRVPARDTVFLRLRLGLPLRMHLFWDGRPPRESAFPYHVRVAVGVVSAADARKLGATGALRSQGISETESIRVERRSAGEMDCTQWGHTITRKDPAGALQPSDRLFEF